jgi:hypothetical protein
VARVIRLRKGQRVTYTAHRWTGHTFERLERRATVSKIEAERVRVMADFGPCLVWVAREQVNPL